MHDDFLTPIWADRHGTVSTVLADFLHQTRIAFERLAARTYDAPWRDEPSRAPERVAGPPRR